MRTLPIPSALLLEVMWAAAGCAAARDDGSTPTVDASAPDSHRDDAPPTGDALMAAIADAPEGSWLQVNRNRFDDVWAPIGQRATVNGAPFGEPRKIITAWGAMAWDGNRRQLVIWGGGHADYAGNEVYRFSASTLRWERASLPSEVARASSALFFTVDGPMHAPISAHPYDNLEFLPLADRLITFGGASYNTGGPFVLEDGVTKTGPYLWDPSRAGADAVGGQAGSQVNPTMFPAVTGAEAWSNRDSVVTLGTGASRPTGLSPFVNGTTAYALEDGVESLLISEAPTTGGDLFRYRIGSLADPAHDEWQLIGRGNSSYGDQGAGAYDPVHRVYLRTARKNGGYAIVMWNVATPGEANTPIAFAPGGELVLTNQHGMDFDHARGCFVLWDGTSAVWYLTPPATGPAFTTTGWTVTRAPIHGSAQPQLASTTGVLGKWKYLASHDVMMGLGDGREGQVWIYKPIGWQQP